MKHKVGDRVKVKTRDNIAKTFGIDKNGDIVVCNMVFTKEMQKYCGLYVTISKSDYSGYNIKEGGHILQDRMFEEKEKFKEGDIFYVDDRSEANCFKDKKERICLANIKGFYLCVNSGHEEHYNNGEKFAVCIRKYAVKKPIEEKKERKVMMTDREREEFKKKIE